MARTEDDEQALFIAMPERHLVSAAEVSRDGAVVLPVGRVGDLPDTPVGASVFVVPIDDDGLAGPAATWRASLLRWEEGSPGPGSAPEPLPPTWVEERTELGDPLVPGRAAPEAEDIADPQEQAAADDDDDDDDDEDLDDEDERDRPRQAFVIVEALERLERRDWVFANEVVSKQRRGARSFVPMTPTLARLPD